MRLWKIRVKHYAPKDSHEAIQGFLLRDTEEEVLGYVTKNLCLMDVDDLNEIVEEWDDDYEDCEEVTMRESLMRSHGEIENSHCTCEDSFYGVAHYSWEDMGEIKTDDMPGFMQVKFLEGLGLFIDHKLEEDE